MTELGIPGRAISKWAGAASQDQARGQDFPMVPIDLEDEP